MEMHSTIIFGDFTEEERLLFFSDENVKSSCIEFPEEWNLFPACGEQEYPKTELNISSRVENVDNSAGLTTEGEFREDLRRVEDAAVIFLVGPTSKEIVNEPLQVSENINEVHSLEKYASDSAKSNSIPIAQYEESEKKILEEECAPNDVLLHNNVQNGEAPGINSPEVKSNSQSVEPSSLANVVTVGTKTMMTTTSTRTAQSRNEGVKSSWADLFKTKSSSKPQGPLPPTKPPETLQQVDDGVEENNLSKNDQFQHYFLDVLRKVSLTNRVPSLQPRGLKNNGNWCYINSTLQVLLFCPSFYHFLMRFKLKTDRGTSFTPILDALVLFASQYNEMSTPQHSTGKSRDWSKQDVVMGMAFEPTYVYKLLTRVKTSLSQQGKQEDAEEFLSCILNGLHEEMVQLSTQGDKPQPDTASKPAVGEQAVGEWEQVGPRNRSTITRKATLSKSPVAVMFGGYLRSSLVQPGMKESASIQPFFTIQLDLRGEVSTVQQAFDNFFRVEEVEGFQCDKSKTEVEVSKKWTLDTLPVVLVLHLKRFVVNKNGCEKLTKKISYEPQLQLPMETISKGMKFRSKNMLTYKLFAVTYHHGKNLHGGHYTSDISHPTVGWLRADDMNVRTVPPKFVFNPLSNRDPYLLYYCRGDISN